MTLINDRFNGVEASVAIKAPVKVATTANITLSGLQTIDGVALSAGNRVLVKDQTDATENGIYEAQTGTWYRAKDFDGARDIVKGTSIFVKGGVVNLDKTFTLTTTDPVVGTSNLSFQARYEVITTDFDDQSALVASLSTTHGVGSIWKAGATLWEEAAAAATDQHLTTAGGVKLYEAGPYFSSRARAVAWWARMVAASKTVAEGYRISWPEASVEASTGATAISDMLGWLPIIPTPMHWGAVGDGTGDDTTEVQAWADYIVTLCAAQRANMPGATKGRAGVSVIADLGAKTYLVTSQIVLSGADGALVTNGVLVAGSGFTATDAVIYADFTWWLYLSRSLHIQCDDKCNGVDLQRCWGADVACRAMGWGMKDYGVRLGPLDYSISARVDGAWLAGFISQDGYYVGTTEPVLLNPTTRTGRGLWVQANDVNVENIFSALCLYPISIEGGGVLVSGSHIYNGQPGDHPSALSNAVGIHLEDAGIVTIWDNYIDNCGVEIVGNPSNTMIKDNVLFTAGDKTQTSFVVLKPSASGTNINSLQISGNTGSGTYDNIIEVDTTNGDFDRIFRSFIGDNFVTEYTEQYPFRGATRGTIDVNTSALTPDGNNVYTVDLTPHIFPISGNNSSYFNCTVGYQRFSGVSGTDTTQVLWWEVDIANMELKIKASAALGGRLTIQFDMSPQSAVVT